MAERYRRVGARYQARFGKEPPELPEEPLQAGNVLRQMVAALNARAAVLVRNGPPLRVVHKDDPA